MLILFILPITIYLLIRISLIAIYVFSINPGVHMELYQNAHPQLTEEDFDQGLLKLNNIMNKPFEEKQQNRWIKYKNYESWTKSAGTFIIAALSIINVLAHLSTLHNNYTYVLILILPSIVQIINELLIPFEIDSPIPARPITPERYYYKYCKKNSDKM